MRQHFVLGIVGYRRGVEAPVDMVDYLVSFEGPPIIRIKFCPFCGTGLDANAATRTLMLKPQ